MARHRGQDQRARELFETCLERFREIGDQRCTSRMLSALGLVVAESGRTRRAAGLLKESLELGLLVDDKWVLHDSLGGLAGLMSSTGQDRQAVRLYAASDRLRREHELPIPEPASRPRRQAIESLRSRMDTEAFEATWRTGETMTLDEALAMALKVDVA